MSQDKLIFKSFYTRHFKAVHGFCRVFVKEDEVALDITQDAFFRLYERWDANYTVQNAQALYIYNGQKSLYGSSSPEEDGNYGCGEGNTGFRSLSSGRNYPAGSNYGNSTGDIHINRA